MKKLYYLIVIAVILGLALTGCSLLSNISQVPTTEQSGMTYVTKGGPTESEAESFPLYAGQDWEVGEVLVWNDDTQVCVKYVLDQDVVNAGWGLTETHLAIVTDPAYVPQTKPKKGEDYGNPKVGHFLYGDCELGGVIEDGPYCVSLKDLGVECGNELIIAAHAVIEKHEGCNEIGDVYGIQRYTGKVFGVDVTTGETAEIFTTVTPPKTKLGPNGLAYDGENRRFYYCDYKSTGTLYFWDGTQELVAGTLPGNIAAADFYDGKYYFITGPPASDNLYEVTFNADGTIAGGNVTEIADIANNEHGWNFSGDIAVKDGMVYGWGLCNKSGHGFEFFTYDLDTGVFTWNKTAYQQSLQLAFGLDGELYGHRSGGNGDFFVIDTENNGAVSWACDTERILFTDCASGAICIPDTKSESAWGAASEGEIRFVSKGNWATYFKYVIGCANCPSITSTNNITEISGLNDVSPDAYLSDLPVIFSEYAGSDHGGFNLDIVGKTVQIPTGATVESGVPVCSYYVHFDNGGVSSKVAEGYITFDKPVIGLIVAGTYNPNDIFNKASIYTMYDINTKFDTGIAYPFKGKAAGLEIYYTDLEDVQSQDNVWVVDDTVYFKLSIHDRHDAFRIIVEPEY